MISKHHYSLYGEKEKGYKRLLYNPYLPRGQNAQACIFDLTAEDVRYYYDVACDLTNEVCEALLSALGDSHQVWPVDRFLVTSMMHVVLYGDALGKAFVSQHGDEASSFVAKYHKPTPEGMGWVEYSVSAIDLGLVERAICTVLQDHGIQVVYESGANGQAMRPPFYRTVRALVGEIKRSVRDYSWIGKTLLVSSGKPLLIHCNGFLDRQELERLNGTISARGIDDWTSAVVRGLQRRASAVRSQRVVSEAREAWKRSLGELAVEKYDSTLGRSLPVVADMYPVSLLEERNYLLKEARRLVKLLRFRIRKQRIVLSIDHRIWKFGWAGALAQALMEAGCFVVGTQHGSLGHWRCYPWESAEQALRTHFAAFTKRPFVHVAGDSPKILPISLPRIFHSVSGCPSAQASKYSIWYFPHHLQSDPEDGVQYHFTDHVRPENYFERTTSILTAFFRVAQSPKVREIVIKPKPDNIRIVDIYRAFVAELLAKDSSGKVRLVDRHMTMPEALPFVSIAVHDMFSTGALQTISFDIPTIILLGEQEGVPPNLRYADAWAESGAFVRHPQEVGSVLTRWINCNFRIPVQLSQSFKEDWCGSGNPTLEEQLGSLLVPGRTP